MGDSSEAEERQSDPVRRSRRRRKSKREPSAEQSRPAGQSHTQSVYPLVQVIKYLYFYSYPVFSNLSLIVNFFMVDMMDLFCFVSMYFCPFVSSLKENSGFLLSALLKRGLSEEQSVPDTMPMATAAPDAFKLDAMTPEPEDLDTVAPNSAAPSPSHPHSLAPGSQHSPSSPGPGDPLEEDLQSRLSQLVSHANSRDSSSSEEEHTKWPADKQMDKESDRLREKRPKDTEREKQKASDRLRDRNGSRGRERATETVEQVNGQEMKKSERFKKSLSVREEGRVRERRLEKGGASFKEKVDDQEQKRGDKREPNRQSKRQHARDVEKEAEQKGGARRSGSSATSPAITPSSHEGVQSDNQVRRLEKVQ